MTLHILSDVNISYYGWAIHKRAETKTWPSKVLWIHLTCDAMIWIIIQADKKTNKNVLSLHKYSIFMVMSVNKVTSRVRYQALASAASQWRVWRQTNAKPVASIALLYHYSTTDSITRSDRSRDTVSYSV